MGWHKYDLNLKIGGIRKEQAILHEYAETMIEDVVNTIRDSIRRFNTEKDLYVSKLQEKIEELETVIKKCKEQKDKSEPL